MSEKPKLRASGLCRRGLGHSGGEGPPIAQILLLEFEGGGFGIFGDYLFGDYSRAGGSVSDSVLGPVLGEGVSDIVTLWNDLKGATDSAGIEHAKRDVPADLLRIGLNNAPFVNLFYIRAALNWLFLDSAQEALSPRYLHRSERALRKRTGHTYMVAPSPVSTVLPWMAGPPSQNHLHVFGH